VSVVAERFQLVSFKSVVRGALDELWQKTNVLLPRNLLEAILGEDALAAIRRSLRRSTGVMLTPEEVVGGVRRLLNETALGELEDVRITFRQHKTKRTRSKTKHQAETTTSAEQEDQGVDATEQEEAEEKEPAADSEWADEEAGSGQETEQERTEKQ